MPLPSCASEAMGTRSSATKTRTVARFLTMDFMGTSSFLLFVVLGLAGIGIGILLAGCGGASRAVASDLPEAVRRFCDVIRTAGQILVVDSLVRELLAQVILVSVLAVGHRLAFGFGFAEAGGNHFAFVLPVSARGRRQCHKQCRCVYEMSHSSVFPQRFGWTVWSA